MPDQKTSIGLVEKYANVLLKNEPIQMINYLQNKLKGDISFDFLIPYILDIPEFHNEKAVKAD